MRTLLLSILCLMVIPIAAKAAACLVAATGVSFGVYVPSQMGPTDSTGTVTVSCTAVAEQVQYTIALSAGQNAAGGVLTRRLQSGISFLSYQLYTDSARTTIWGDGNGGTSTLADSYLCAPCVNQIRNFSTHGRLPGGQFSAGPGNYADTITVTITFN